jgi:hypothetical protein
MNERYVKHERILLKDHPLLTEKWVQNLIAEDPSVLGLGDLVLRDRKPIFKSSSCSVGCGEYPVTRVGISTAFFLCCQQAKQLKIFSPRAPQDQFPCRLRWG